MGQIIKEATYHNWVFWISLIISIILIVGGAIVPPPFIIDSSIFSAVGWLFGFASLGVLGHAIDKGIDARIKHGDTIVEVGDLNNKEED